MDVTVFFRKLYKEGIKIVLKDDGLNIKSDSKIKPETLAEIKRNKELLIDYLKSYENDESSEKLLAKVVPYNKEELSHIPLSFSQERFWFLDQLQGGSEEYHIHTVIRLKGGIDTVILETI